ncbi:unnamed protein product [Lactuca saligna]|uniref:RRM domain-containing protein n=1 Tax=Lactuca saligna TaxID=75948 RepID=A0AA36DZ99_LACSI|nr:unnamed protein product [Lactuca saligna]
MVGTVENTLFEDGDGANTFCAFNPTQAEETYSMVTANRFWSQIFGGRPRDAWTKVCWRQKQPNRIDYSRRWEGDDVSTMFVTNIPGGSSKEEIERMFQNHGDVRDIYMVTKKDSSHRNFAFVRFRDIADES